jgi:hypothetical protein
MFFKRVFQHSAAPLQPDVKALPARSRSRWPPAMPAHHSQHCHTASPMAPSQTGMHRRAKTPHPCRRRRMCTQGGGACACAYAYACARACIRVDIAIGRINEPISMSRSRSILSGNISWRAGPFQGIRLRICLQGPTPGSRQSAGAHTATGIGRRKRESARQHTHLHAGDSTCTQWHQDRERFIRHASYAYACETKLKSCMSCFFQELTTSIPCIAMHRHATATAHLYTERQR